MTNSENKYAEFKSSVDKLANKLHIIHKDHMQCKKGCDMCCMDYEIFPIEFETIKRAISNIKIEFGSAEKGACIFLKEQICQIYEYRPIICRTHGLPLLFMNNDQWELSACELNFAEFEDDGFTEENTFPQDKFNSQLFLLNKEYLKEIDSPKGEFELIPIHQLKN